MSVERVAAFERKAKVKLPADYRTFLASHVDAYGLSGRVERANTSLTLLLVLGDEEFCRSLVDTCEMYEHRMPPSVIPIGADNFGNAFCLGLVGTPHEAKVYFWDHELEAGDDEVPTFDNMILVANSFTELLASLRPR